MDYEKETEELMLDLCDWLMKRKASKAATLNVCLGLIGAIAKSLNIPIDSICRNLIDVERIVELEDAAR